MSQKSFKGVYPFTTENNSYICSMDIESKDVLTLGSSCDQAFNSLLMGAKEVTIFDLSKKVEDFYHLKRKCILELSREKMVEKVTKSSEFSFMEEAFSYNQLKRMNLYLQSDENYKKLREILESKTVHILGGGDIFSDDISSMENRKFDRVILSNVLQYHPKKKQINEQDVYNFYQSLSCYLSEDAIVELYYLYGSIYPKGFTKIVDEFLKHDLLFTRVPCEKDAAILVRKM